MPSIEKMLFAKHENRTFKIVQDSNAGFYLYVCEDDKCTHDYLQDTEFLAKQCAKELFGVSLDSWTIDHRNA